MMPYRAAPLYTGQIMKVHRRNLLAGLALGGAFLESEAEAADEASAIHDSLYIPKAHLVDDRKFLHDFMDEFSFVELITATPTLRITHIPCFIDRSRGDYGTIFGHISRNNPQSKTFDGEHAAVIVFRGPHGYISPSWYPKSDLAVPTWNFGVVHASGRLQPVAEKATLRGLLAKLIDKNEDYRKSTYNFAKLPDSYIGGMLGGIIGFEMKVELLEGKFKLGHERNETDRASMVEHLKSEKRERSLDDLTADFYKNHPAPPPKA
jgi:transcriptional regulator